MYRVCLGFTSSSTVSGGVNVPRHSAAAIRPDGELQRPPPAGLPVEMFVFLSSDELQSDKCSLKMYFT